MMDKSVAHMLSIVASVYGVLIYSLAFALEMWFIFSTDLLDYTTNTYETSVSVFSNDTLNSSVNTDYRPNGGDHLISPTFNPMFAFILAAIYFIVVVVSLLLMLGLIIRSMLCLLSWVITMALLFFPEFGLVLHLTLTIWRIDSRNGQIELCFYVVRAIMNVFFIICVQNLICQWRAEKQMSNYVSNLNAFQGYPGLPAAAAAASALNGFGSSDPYYHFTSHHHHLRQPLNHQFHHIDVGNLTTTTSNSASNLNPHSFKYNTLGRLNHYGPGIGGGSFASMNGGFAIGGGQQIKLNPLNYGYNTSGFSEFDARNFQDFLFKKNLFLEELQDPIMTSGINLNQKPINYSTQSLDRRRFMQSQPRSMITGHNNNNHHHNMREEEVTLRPLATRPFDYLQRPGSVSNLNNNDDAKINLNLQTSSPAHMINHKLSRSSQSFSEKSIAFPPVTTTSTTIHDKNSSSMHSIRDIAL